MELTIFRRGQAAGTLTAEEDGLYRVLWARIAPSRDILRLYLRGKAFGVFAPEDGALCLRRRVSRTQLPELPEYAVAWCASDGCWTESEAGFCRYSPEGRELAVRWRIDGPMSFPAAPETLRAERIGDVCCLVCSLPDQ